MKELEIKPGVKVRKSEIIFTEDLPEGKTRVSTLNATWDCDFPSNVIWMLINRENVEEGFVKEPRKPFAEVFGNQYWAG